MVKARAAHAETLPESTYTPVINLLDGARISLPGGLSHGDAMEAADLAADELSNVDYIGAAREKVSHG